MIKTNKTNKSIKPKNTFWLNDFSILYKNYTSVFPTSEMTRVEQLNAVTRLCIYFILILIGFQKTENWLQVPIIIIVFVVIIYYIFEFDKEGKLRELFRTNKKIENLNDMSKDTTQNHTKIESGYIDASNNYNVGPYYGSQNPSQSVEPRVDYNLDENNEYKNSSCRRPTPDNPFMNTPVDEFEQYDPPKACNVEDNEIKDQMRLSFNDNLFRDVSDVFEIKNSQRQFYTVPQMNPPDQDAFANWLYGTTGSICKVNPSNCLKYEDIRYNSGHQFNMN
jgi:hypothetical protein